MANKKGETSTCKIVFLLYVYDNFFFLHMDHSLTDPRNLRPQHLAEVESLTYGARDAHSGGLEISAAQNTARSDSEELLTAIDLHDPNPFGGRTGGWDLDGK